MMNDPMISALWETYKKEAWWKKIITFLPFVLLLILFVVIFILVRKNQEEEVATFDNSEAKVEEAIEVGQGNLGKLEKEEDKLKEKKDNIVKEYKEDEKDISGANDDFNKLTNIAKNISSRTRSRE
jgi:flagellar biosynthesis/type III secretory pathway M-ring protein FliF/YscJ